MPSAALTGDMRLLPPGSWRLGRQRERGSGSPLEGIPPTSEPCPVLGKHSLDLESFSVPSFLLRVPLKELRSSESTARKRGCKPASGRGSGKRKISISKSVLQGAVLSAVRLPSHRFANKASPEGPSWPQVAGGEVEAAAGALRPAGDATRERSGRQGALRAGLRGRNRWQRLGPVRGRKGKITGARGREGLRDCVEGTRDCRVGQPAPGIDPRGGSDSPREGRPGPHPQPGCPPRVPQAGAGSAAGGGGGAAERRAEGGPGRGASAWLREAVRAGAGRVRPPGAAGRAAFLMCHQHVEPARAAPQAGGTPPTFEGSCCPAPLPAAPGSRSLGRGRRRPPGPGQVERGPGPRPPARRVWGVRNVGAPGRAGGCSP